MRIRIRHVVVMINIHYVSEGSHKYSQTNVAVFSGSSLSVTCSVV